MQFQTKLLFISGLLAFLVSTGRAWAIDPEVEARFKNGVELFKEADFRAALVEFRRAYDKSKNPKILYNIAQCHYQLTDYVAALASFERYLKDAAPVIDHARRAEVEEELPRLRARIASLTVKTNVPGATVSVDDEAAVTTPLTAPILLNPGPHRIVVRKPGYVESSQKIEVAGGDYPTVTVELGEQPVAARSSVAPPNPNAAGGTLKTAGIIIGAAGLVTIGVGTVFGLSAKSKNDEAAGMCSGLECSTAHAITLTEEARTAATISTVGFVAGGALLAGGVVLYLLAPKGESKTALRLAPRVGPQTALLSMGGNF